MRTYTNVSATFARPRKQCSLCFVSHLPAACPGERVAAPGKAKCGNCFITHLPTACTGLVVEKTLQKVCASCFLTHLPGEHPPFTRFDPRVYRQMAKSTNFSDAMRQQGMGPTKEMSDEELSVEISNNLKSTGERLGEMLSNDERFQKFIQDRIAQNRPLVRKQRRPADSGAIIGAAFGPSGTTPEQVPVDTGSRKRLWRDCSSIAGRKGEHQTLSITPGVLCRVHRTNLQDSWGGTATRIQQIFVGSRQQINLPYANFTTEGFMKMLDAGCPVIRENKLDTCQMMLSISIQIQFLEDATFVAELTGECLLDSY